MTTLWHHIHVLFLSNFEFSVDLSIDWLIRVKPHASFLFWSVVFSSSLLFFKKRGHFVFEIKNNR